MEMTKGLLRDTCTQNKLYRTPHLNDKLYLNFRGFTHLACLEEYTSLKALFLEGNALQSLQGLPRLESLKCLYVQQNCLRSLDGLEQAPNLNTLNISSNGLASLELLQSCPQLGTLLADHNHLSTVASLQPLLACSELHTLDLQHNMLQDTAVLDAVIAQLPQLRCLYLQGNPVVSNIPNYRKVLIARCPALTYLDDRPVTPEERLWCEAWHSGGMEAECAERARQKQESAAKERRNFEWLQQLRREGFRKRRAMLGLPDGDTDPYFDTLPDQQSRSARVGTSTAALGSNGSSQADPASEACVSDGQSSEDEDYLHEPPELLAARQRLAAYPATSTDTAGLGTQLSSKGALGDEDLADGAVYFAAVKEAQQELDAAGAAGTPAPAREEDWVGSEAHRSKMASLRAANEAALSAIGMAGLPPAASAGASTDTSGGCAAPVPAAVRVASTDRSSDGGAAKATGSGTGSAGSLGALGSWSSAVTDVASEGEADPGAKAAASSAPTACQGPAVTDVRAADPTIGAAAAAGGEAADSVAAADVVLQVAGVEQRQHADELSSGPGAGLLYDLD